MKLGMADMHAAVDDASALMRAFGNSHRLLIACLLFEREQTVGELAKSLGIRSSSVSQHLAVLRHDRFVAARRDGHLIWYSIASEPARAVIGTLYVHYCAPLARKDAKLRKAKPGSTVASRAKRKR